MGLKFLKGDDQDRVYGLMNLGTAIRNGESSIDCFINNKNKFGLTSDDVKILGRARAVFRKLRISYIDEVRCPDEMIDLQNELCKLKNKR